MLQSKKQRSACRKRTFYTKCQYWIPAQIAKQKPLLMHKLKRKTESCKGEADAILQKWAEAKGLYEILTKQKKVIKSR
jgi:hypothetical protein